MTGTIETIHVSKEYSSGARLLGKRTTTLAVDDLSLTVPRGRVTGLLGLNGAGKTTTIKMMATLLRPTRGTVLVDGLDTVREARRVRQRINLVSGAERLVYTRLTGRENLAYFGTLYGIPSTALNARTTRLLDMVGLADVADKPVERYSRGMMQRLSIARGLVNDPEYLLLDEPTTGLDAPIARELRALVADLAEQGTGILLTSHYLAEVHELCHTVWVIAAGRHLIQGTPEEIIAKSGVTMTISVTVAGDGESVVDIAHRFAGECTAGVSIQPDDSGAHVVSLLHTEDVAGALVTEFAMKGMTVRGVSTARPTLEDAVVKLTAAAETR